MLKYLLLCLTLLSVGCSSTFYRNETVEKLDLKRYMGKWYVIAHIPTFFVKDAYDAVENYTLTKHDEILVNFSYLQEGHDGRPQSMEQVGWVYDESTNAHWMIRPFWPLKFHHLIHYVNDDYTASMMGVPNHQYLWLMSRTPTLNEKERQVMEEMAESLGYDLNQLQEIPHQSK